MTRCWRRDTISPSLPLVRPIKSHVIFPFLLVYLRKQVGALDLSVFYKIFLLLSVCSESL